MLTPSIGLSQFARGRHYGPRATVRFCGRPEQLLDLVREYWWAREPGAGRGDLSEVVVVPIHSPRVSELFTCPWIPIEQARDIHGVVERRQGHEDPYVALTGVGPTLPVKFARVVLYSSATLLRDDGERSTDCDWEIVALMAGPWKDEPMMPLTMARNFLRLPGGTFAPYTAEQFAQSIAFWRGFVQQRT